MDLNLIWFCLLTMLTMGYAVLDGFDFGVGMIQPVLGRADNRNVAIKAIGPLWDGNEVWLVVLGGALFAAFPEAYATIMSAFYLPVMGLLFCLIVRAVSIDFRNKVESKTWKRIWDGGFFLSSLLATVLFGLLVGKLMQGIPLDERGVFTGSTADLVSGFSLLVAGLTVATFLLHGILFLYLKTAGPVQQSLLLPMWLALVGFLIFYLIVSVYATLNLPHAVQWFQQFPAWGLVVLIHLLAIGSIPWWVSHRRFGWAFVSSSLNIICLVILFGIAIFPNLVISSSSADSLTIYTAASSSATLQLMLIFALIGLPLIASYTVIIYWTFRGKVH